jgi:peptidoglycan/xylan/chitin deacetylase (PgdA/CDA1 family)
MYHSIGGRGLSPDLVISPRRFEGHIRYLRRHRRVMSLADAVALLQAGRPVPADTVVVTLDDGYRDAYDHAFPILRRHACPATVFIAVEVVDTGRIPWPQSLWRCLNLTRKLELHTSWRGRNDSRIQTPLSLRTAADRAAAHATLKLFVGGLGAPERHEILESIARELEVAPEPEPARATLSWEQLREMQRAGIAVGSHTLTHPRLSALDDTALRHELVESRRRLSQELATSITLFAYPFGSPEFFDDRSKRAVVEAGYAAACSAVIGPADASSDLRALDRAAVPDEPVWKFALRLLQLETGSRLLAWTLRGASE